MIDDDLSGLPRSALRDYADDPRVERVWQRLESELGERPSRTRSGLVVLAPAFGVALFLAGVLVGRNVLPPSAPASPDVQAERLVPVEASPAVPQPATDSGRVTAPQPSSRPRPASHRATSAAPVSPAVEVEAEREIVPSVPHTPHTPPAPPEWLKLAESGDFVAARAALEREGGFDSSLRDASADQLLVLVDVARASGSREQAVRALRRLLDRYPGAPEAPLAAWTLGNMLEQSGDAAGAADAFALYRRLSPAGDFAEDAAARQVHVALEQGDAELAVRLLEQYAKDFPNGRRLAELREELAKLETEQAYGGTVHPESPAPVPAPSEVPAPPTP